MIELKDEIMDNLDIPDGSHEELQRIHEEAKKLSVERQKLHSKKQLTNMLTKKFKTTMIGSLASFEGYFGSLWGHGKSTENLTEAESTWRDLWEQVRTDILNKGNSQLRAALEEINNYELEWKKYQTRFIVKQDSEENDNE